MNQKPPIVLNRARGLGDIITDTFSIQGANIGTFALAAGPAVLMNIIFQLVTLLLLPDGQEYSDTLTDEEVRELLTDLAIFGGIVLAMLPIYFIIYQLSSAAVIAVVAAVGEGRPIKGGDALDAAQDRAKDILLAVLKLTTITILLAITIVGIPWAIKKGIQWSLVTQSVMIDGVSHREALAHSARLVENDWWVTLGRLLVIGILVGIFGGAASIIQGAIPGVPGAIIGGCVGFLTVPYSIIASTLIFYDYKHRKTPPPTSPAVEPLT